MHNLEAIVARHLLSHREDSAYAVAQHLRLPRATAHRAVQRVRETAASEHALVALLLRRTITHRTLHVRHPAVERWLSRLPAPVSLSGEDAAAVDGAPLVPHRHLFYVREEDLSLVLRSLEATDGDLVAPEEGNVTLRVRDPWLMDDPAPLVERGQRLVDYLESGNVQILRGLRLGG